MDENYPSVDLVTKTKTVITATCFRCGGTWEPKTVGGVIKSMPKNCALCNSPYWNKPRQRARAGSSAANKYGFDLIEIGKWREFPTFTTEGGGIVVERNSRFWRALEQFMRRKGYTYAWEGTAKAFRVMRRT